MKQHADGFASSSKSPPKETCEMSSQEFIARINALIPSPNEEANKNLLDFGNSLWLRLKEDLYNAFSFISRHFTPDTLQGVYDLSGIANKGMLPWEMIGAAIYLQTNTPVQEIKEDSWDYFVGFTAPEAPDKISSLALCTVHENGCAAQFYTRHFGRFDPLELLYNATARSVYNGVTITEAIQQFDCNMEIRHPWETAVILDPEPKMVEKLTQLMPDSPIIAAHINLDADSGTVATEINPLWEKLRDELDELSHGQQQKTSEKKRSSKRSHQMER